MSRIDYLKGSIARMVMELRAETGELPSSIPVAGSDCSIVLRLEPSVVSHSARPVYFDGQTRPTHAGVYERDAVGVVAFSYWDGVRWNMSATTVSGAYMANDTPSFFQNLKWRAI